MENKNVQKAGENSQQLQADTIIINQGITEQRAREICSEMAKQAISDNTAEAHEIANQRIEQFANQLIPRIQQIEENFQSFSDPSFQVLLRKAQLTAACMEREDDYSILSELLVHRIKNKKNVKKKASITKAVEIVDQIDDDSLLALTVFLVMTQYVPTSGDIKQGIKTIADFYSKFDLENLPNNVLWIDNLSILGALTWNNIGKLKKFEDYFSENLSGYVCAGIKKDSDDYKRAIEILAPYGIGEGYFTDNILLEGYVRLPVRNKESIAELKFNAKINNNERIIIFNEPISKDRLECLNKVYDMYSNDRALITHAKNKFIELLNSYESIHKAVEWWNSINNSISLTSVGRVIAHTNAKSIDPTLPDLD